MLRAILTSTLVLAAACAHVEPAEGTAGPDASTVDGPQADGGPSTVDGPQGDGGPKSDGGPCTAPLSQPLGWGDQTCPATYPAPGTNCYDGGTFQPGVSTGSCGAFQAVLFSYVTHTLVCVYASANGGALVGGRAVDDINSFCNHTSDTIVAGEVPDSCLPDTPVPGYCSARDAGDAGGD
jgi:hypothetical protein